MRLGGGGGRSEGVGGVEEAVVTCGWERFRLREARRRMVSCVAVG